MKLATLEHKYDDLQNKIDPTNTTVKAENIADTKKCIKCIKPEDLSEQIRIRSSYRPDTR